MSKSNNDNLNGNCDSDQHEKSKNGLSGESGDIKPCDSPESRKNTNSDTNLHTTGKHVYINACFTPDSDNDYDSKGKNDVFRSAIQWQDLENRYGKQKLGRRVSTSARISQNAAQCCADFSILNYILHLFPIITWIRKYSIKEDLLHDVIAGLTISVLHIPQGMAYGLLAGVSPIAGLYVSFFPVIIYSIMGTSQHVSIGTFAVVSIMLRNIAFKAGAEVQTTNVENSTLHYGELPLTNLEVLNSACLLTGVMMALMGFMHLGVLSLILSDQLVSAFSCGSAIHVATSQVANLFGISMKDTESGPLNVVWTWLDLLQKISKTNIVTLLLAISAMLVLIVFKEIIEPALKTRFKINTAIPIDIFVLILGTFISYILKLHKLHSISIMGEIPTGLPSVEVPRLDLLPRLIPDAFVISIVTFTISLSLGKLYAKKYKYQVRPNQELIAMGTANLVSSFFSCFPCSASLSRSSVLEKAGAKTQLAGVVTSIVILIVLLFLGPFLYHLPKCILASIILVALKGMFVQMSDLKKYWKISRFEGISWVVTFLSVIFLDVDIGLVVGVICSVLIILVQFVLPNSSLLGQLPNTEIYVDISHFNRAREIEHTKIFRFSSALFFLNRDTFKESFFRQTLKTSYNVILKEISKNQIIRRPIKCIIIDCSSMSYIDSSGSETILEVINILRDLNIYCYLAACTATVMGMFERTAFLDDLPRCMSGIFPTIHDAVIFFQQNSQ